MCMRACVRETMLLLVLNIDCLQNGKQRMGKWIDEPHTLKYVNFYLTSRLSCTRIYVDYFRWARTLNFVAFLTRFRLFFLHSLVFVMAMILLNRANNFDAYTRKKQNCKKRERARAMLKREWYPSENFSWKINQREKCVVSHTASRFHINSRKFHSLSNLHIISQSKRKWENK